MLVHVPARLGVPHRIGIDAGDGFVKRSACREAAVVPGDVRSAGTAFVCLHFPTLVLQSGLTRFVRHSGGGPYVTFWHER